MSENKKLKVLCLVDNFYPVTGGINSVLDLSCPELNKYIDIAVCAIKHRTYVDPERSYKVYRCPGFYNCITNDGIAQPTKEFEQFIADQHFDLFHCHTAGSLLGFAQKLGKKLNIPVLTTIHNTYYTEVKSFVKFGFLAKLVTKIFFKRTQEKSDYLWAVSKYCIENAKRFGLTKPAKVMYNAIKFDDFSPEKVKEGCKIINKDFNIKEDDFVISTVSRIIKTKNLDVILDCAKLIKDNHPEIKNIKFFVVGGGKYLEKMKKRAKKLGVDKDFFFTDMIKDRTYLANFYMRSDLVLFPSVMESIGLIQTEAAAYEKVTLVFEGTAQSEEIIDMKNGLIAPRSAQGYLDKILYAYNNPEEIKKIGKKARETLFRSYTDKKVTDHIINEYKNIIADFKAKKQENDAKAK